MRIIAFCNQKGGVGKSTTCFNVGAALTLSGKKVLFVDGDPQGDLSTMAGFRTIPESDLTLYDVLHGEDINKAIKEGSSGSIIVSDDTLARGEADLLKESRFALKKALNRLKTYFDFVLIDCPPSLGILTINELTAADEVIIPVGARYLELRGVSRLRSTLETVQEKLNPELTVSGVVVTFYNGQRNLDKEVKESLENAFGSRVFETTISQSVKLGEAPSFGESIFEHSPRSKAAAQYKALAAEIVQSVKE